MRGAVEAVALAGIGTGGQQPLHAAAESVQRRQVQRAEAALLFLHRQFGSVRQQQFLTRVLGKLADSRNPLTLARGKEPIRSMANRMIPAAICSGVLVPKPRSNASVAKL